MDNFSVHTFSLDHIEDFEPQEWQEKEYGCFVSRSKKLATACSENDHSLTITFNEKPLCLCGIETLHTCGCNAWLFFSTEKSKLNIRSVTKIVKYLFEYLKNVGFLWVQTLVRQDFIKAHKWARLLGFSDTGDSVMYFDDMYTYWKKVF